MTTTELTEMQAVDMAIELWDWAVANPDKNKEDWPGWVTSNTNRLIHKRTFTNCPLCAYQVLLHPVWNPIDSCEGCPSFRYFNGCSGKDSSFNKWVNARMEDRDSQTTRDLAQAVLEGLLGLKVLLIGKEVHQ